MNETELLDLWQSSGEEHQPETAFTVRELAHRAPLQRAGTGRLPPVSADCATFLAATLEAHRSKTLARLQVREFFAAGRAIDRLQDLMGWSPKASPERPVLALSLAVVAALSVTGVVLWNPWKSAPVLARAAADPAEVIEDLLAECRTYANPEAGLTDWPRANTACQKVLDLEPLHPEANAQLRRIAVLEVCEQRLKKAQLEISAGRLEEALEPLTAIGKDCEIYLLRSLSIAKETADAVKARAGRDCKAYADNDRWDLALERCELYSRLACQGNEPRDLYPPALMTLKLEGPLNPKTQWRPSDPIYVDFLKARAKVLPGLPTWMCPDVPAFRAPPAPPDPAKLARDELAIRYAEPELGRALVLYFQGDFQSAPVPLQKIRESMSKAQFHEEARALMHDMLGAINLYENGIAQIAHGRPERAEAPFLAALALDEKLMLGSRGPTLSPDERKQQLQRRVSFVRKAIEQTMSSECYEKGKTLADRKDFRAACRVWKLGNSFSRSDIDLLKALTNVCTKRADESFARAETCEQLKAALDYAVDGDGLKEKISQAMTEQGCP